jgi:hypothetical protein
VRPSDLARLARIIDAKVAAAQPGSSISIRDEFSPTSPYALVLEMREDGFDPASADPALPPEAAGSQAFAAGGGCCDHEPPRLKRIR